MILVDLAAGEAAAPARKVLLSQEEEVVVVGAGEVQNLRRLKWSARRSETRGEAEEEGLYVLW